MSIRPNMLGFLFISLVYLKQGFVFRVCSCIPCIPLRLPMIMTRDDNKCTIFMLKINYNDKGLNKSGFITF